MVFTSGFVGCERSGRDPGCPRSIRRGLRVAGTDTEATPSISTKDWAFSIERSHQSASRSQSRSQTDPAQPVRPDRLRPAIVVASCATAERTTDEVAGPQPSLGSISLGSLEPEKDCAPIRRSTCRSVVGSAADAGKQRTEEAKVSEA
jgi:hypothetical protein